MSHAGQVFLKKPLAQLLGLGFGTGGFEPEYQAILDYATLQGYTHPSPENKETQNAFLSRLKADGIWDSLDLFYNFFTDGDHNFAKINWKAPGTYQAVGTGHEPVFTVYQGFKGDGIGLYLDTGWTPSTDGVNYTLQLASIFADAYNVVPTNNILWGSGNAGLVDLTLFYPKSVASIYANINSTTGPNNNTPPGTEAVIVATRENNYVRVYWNDLLPLNNNAHPATGLSTFPFALLSFNAAGSYATFFTDNGIAGWGAGNLISKEAMMRNAWVDYKSITLAMRDYQAVIDYAILQGYAVPSTAQQADGIILISDLYKAGVWNSLDVFYNFLTNADHNFAKINWKNPGTFQATGLGHEPQFNPNDGFRGNGTTSYLDTTFVPSVNGVKYKANDASLMVDADGFNLPAPVIEPEYQAILLYAATNGYALPSPAVQLSQRQLIRDMKSAGIWTELDIFYNFINDAVTGDFAKINWKNPSVFYASGVGHEPTWIPMFGFKGDGVAKYLTTQYNPSIHGVKYTLPNAGYVFSLEESLTSFDTYLGFSIPPNYGFAKVSKDGLSSQLYLNDDNGLTFDLPTAAGQFIGRNQGDTPAFYRNGVLITYITTGVTLLPTQPLYLLALSTDGAGTPSFFGDNTISSFGAGTALSGKEPAMYNLWAAYANPLRAQGAYKRITDYATLQGYALPSAGQQTTQKQLILDMINNGSWDRLKVFYNFLTDGDRNFAKINWKAPGTYQAVEVAAPGFAVNKGFTGPTLADYLNTWPGNINNDSAHWSNSAIVWDLNTFNGVALTQDPWGDGSGGFVYCRLFATPTEHNSAIYSSNAMQIALSRDLGLSMVTRTDNANQYIFQDEYTATGFNAANSPGSATPMRCAGDGNGMSSYYMGCFGLGAGFAKGQYDPLNTAWKTYSNPYKATEAYNRITAYATLQGYTLPSAGQQTTGRQLILDLMNNDIWNKIDVFYNFITDGDHNFAKINWKVPGVFQANGAGHDMVFTPNSGFTATVATQYFDTGWIPSANGVHYAINDCSFVVGLGDVGVGGGSSLDLGVYPDDQLYIRYGITGINQFTLNNGGVGNIVTNPGSMEFEQFQRSAGPYRYYKMGVQVGGVAGAAGGAKGTFSFHLNGTNSAGTHLNGNVGRNWQVFAIGNSFIGKELAFFNAWKTYSNPYKATAAYKAITDYATGQGFVLPSAPQQTAQRQLILDLMNAGIWGNLDVFYNFYTNGDAGFAKINWKSPGVGNAAQTGAPTFVPNSGFTGWSSVNFFLTPLLTLLTGFQQDNASMLVDLSNSTTGIACGSTDGNTYNQIDPTFGYFLLNMFSNLAFAAANPNGVYHINKPSALVRKVARNGVEISNVVAGTSSPKLAGAIGIGGRWNVGSSNLELFDPPSIIACFGLGGVTPAPAFYTAWSTYKANA